MLLKTKGFIRDLLPEPESRSPNGANSDILGRTFSAQCDEMPEGRWDSFNMSLINSSFIIHRHIKCPSRHTSVIKPRRRNKYNLCVRVCIQGMCKLAVHITKKNFLWQNEEEAGIHAKYISICTVEPIGVDAKSENEHMNQN